MRLSLLVPLTLVLSASVVELEAQQELSLLATIVDPATGAAVESVEPAELRVTEDGEACTVVRVEPIERVVKVQLLIDNGIGIGAENIGLLRRGLRALIEALPPGLETTLVTTAPQPRTVVRPTTDREQLLRAADQLPPDSGPGRFVEAVSEAAQRAERERDKAFTVLISAATTSGDLNVRESEIQRLFERIQGHPVVVHVLLYAGNINRSASGGETQTDVGLAVTKMTQGRFETINTMTRHATLMAELGAGVAKQAAGQTKQFRIVVRRPNGKSGNLGGLSMSAGGKVVQSVVLQPR
jgi:hypothetical protein